MTQIVPADKCLRGLSICEPLAQIQCDTDKSFVCCGKNNGSDRKVKQDRFTVCFKNKNIDERTHWDEHDLRDHVAVLSWALSLEGQE